MPKTIEVKSVLNKTKRRDPWFLDDYTFNPYSSCAFNCLYCYIRGSKYGYHLEKSLSVKVNAIEVLEKQLHGRAKKGQYGIIVLSSATDPYLKLESIYKLTRQALEVILKYRFPVHIITKSDGVIRDFDLLQKIDQSAILPNDLQSSLGRGTIITYSFSSIDDGIGSIFEPGAPPPSTRLNALESTLKKGFLSGVSLMPLLPFISDTREHLDLMFSTFAKLGIHYIFPATLTLFGSDSASSKTLMFQAIKKHFPELDARYHRYFDAHNELPAFYKKAFSKKMEAMCNTYGLKSSIL